MNDDLLMLFPGRATQVTVSKTEFEPIGLCGLTDKIFQMSGEKKNKKGSVKLIPKKKS